MARQRWSRTSDVTVSIAAPGTPGGPSRSEMVESPQRIEDAVVTGAIRTFWPSTLVPFALPRSWIVTSESATSRRACSRESAASGITISVPPRPIRNRPRRSATSMPAPGPLSTVSSNVAVAGLPGPERNAEPDPLTGPAPSTSTAVSTSTAPWTSGGTPTVMAATGAPRTDSPPVP
ncbi:hypothetical protein ABH915_003235 [Arthrobacter sp. MW3 TE3886]